MTNYLDESPISRERRLLLEASIALKKVTGVSSSVQIASCPLTDIEEEITF
jgi:hypothetical protein